MSKNYEAHPMSFVHPEAKIGNNVKIGPFCVIGANSVIGDDCIFHSNVVVDGHTTIGKNNKFFQFG